ncbi:hypothetical protein L7F22_032981 [Adiantum nelumboides]|nr:hypothetical protein [Adiantum nelumboides]
MALVERASASSFADALVAIPLVKSASGDMLTKPFLDVCREILPVLDKFGAAMALVKSDVGGNITRLDTRYKEDTSAYYLLHDIVRKEISEKKAKNSNSCVNGLLWLTRTPQIQGLHMPIDGSLDLVEQEYVDDTMIFCASCASSFTVWVESSYVDTEIMAMDSGIRRGIATCMVEIDVAIPDDWQQVLKGGRDMPLHVGWWPSFDQAGQTTCSQYGSVIYIVEAFQPEGVHMRICFQGSVPVSHYPNLHWQPVQIVGSLGKRCKVYRVFLVVEAMLWRLWIWEGCPLLQIVWDPGEWCWPSEQRSGDSVT